MKLAVINLDVIHQVEASYKYGKAVVVYEPSRVSPQEIKAAIDKVGFKAELQSEEELTQ